MEQFSIRACQQAHNHFQSVSFGHLIGTMPQITMGNFVADDSRQFIFRFYVSDKSRIHISNPANVAESIVNGVVVSVRNYQLKSLR